MGWVFGVAVEALDGIAQRGVPGVPGGAGVGQVLAVAGTDVRGHGDRRLVCRSAAVRVVAGGPWRARRGVSSEAWRSGQISPGCLPVAGQDSRW